MFQDLLLQVRDFIWGLPLLTLIVGTGVVTTVGLRFVQFRKFFSSWKLIFAKSEGMVGDITPFQAFLKALSAGLGNGSLAGIATAIHTGGPGAAFWIFFIGFLAMILRFCEVYLATSFSTISKTGRVLGGPFLYLSKVPGGSFLPHFYALFCLGYAFLSGMSMQCNSISTAVTEMVPAMPSWAIGVALTSFVLYIMLGGAQRIVKASEVIVPIKVGLFFFTCSGVLIYYWAELIPALLLMVKGAFTPQAVAGGVVGISVQRIFRASLARTINATEAGLGTAGIIYGSTGDNKPLNNGLTAMLGSFISSNLVCTMIAVSIIVSGAWKSGVNGSAMTSIAFQTVFGSIGGWIVTLLTILFGVGVFVAYGFVGRQCWFFLTNDRFEHLFILIYCACAFWGSVADVSVVWAAVDVINAGCLMVNLFAILWLLPYMRSHVLPALNAE
jgi:AGCS family alanine or glycine:cation symporter